MKNISYRRRLPKIARTWRRLEALILRSQKMPIESPDMTTSMRRPAISIAIQRRNYHKSVVVLRARIVHFQHTRDSDPFKVAQGRLRSPRRAISSMLTTVQTPDTALAISTRRVCSVMRVRFLIRKVVDNLVQPTDAMYDS